MCAAMAILARVACAFALRGGGARVLVTECDAIFVLQACMEVFQVVPMEDVRGMIDILISASLSST